MWFMRRIGFVLVLPVMLFMMIGSSAFGQTTKTLDGASIPKYVRPLTILPPMPKSGTTTDYDYYKIAVRQFQQEIVPGMKTTVWGYGSVDFPNSFNYPANTIEATINRPVRVQWINDLKDPKSGKYLKHLLPVDQTLHWANPTGKCVDHMGMPDPSKDRDCMGRAQTAYEGPVPMVPHLHGAHVSEESDGYPEAWFLPNAKNSNSFIPFGSKYEQFKAEAKKLYSVDWSPGNAVFQYPNNQRPTTLWFHDHSLGMTRANVYAGPTGFYLLRGGANDLKNLPSGPYEIPLVIQDKSFKQDGSLFYPDNRAYFEMLNFPTHPEQFLGVGSLQIPFFPDKTKNMPPMNISDISPIWNPEFFGNTIVVNGKTWPYLQVEKRRYRFRILNASDSRFFILKLSNNQSFWQVGNDGGFLAAPVELKRLLIAPAERADVIVDFTTVPANSRLTLLNIGPDEPFGGGEPCPPGQNPIDNEGCGDFVAADPATTGQVMELRVVPMKGKDNSIRPSMLSLPVPDAMGPATNIRKLSLNELMSMRVCVESDTADPPNLVEVKCTDMSNAFGPAKAQLGTLEEDGANPLPWMAEITETPVAGETEIWEINNFTADAHPIHLHQIQFEVVEREFMGEITPPEPWETGFKDTVIAYPGDETPENPGITRVKVKFDIPGLFVWHCHILSHEDNEMMRPIQVLP